MSNIKPSVEYLYEIQKSKFIALIFNINNLKDFEVILDHLKNTHKKARHICYGYKIMENNNLKIKASDDKEPKGVASIPIINAIEKSNLQNIALLVIRYFGGIKLGKGGLYRSYAKAANEAIKIYENNKLN